MSTQNGDDSSDASSYEHEINILRETHLASLLEPRANSTMTEDIETLNALTYHNEYGTSQGEAFVGRGDPFAAVTAMGSTRGKLAVGFDNGFIQIYKCRNLKLKREARVSVLPINRILDHLSYFYFFSGPIVLVTDHSGEQNITRIECESQVTGFLRGNEDRYLIDDRGKLYRFSNDLEIYPGQYMVLDPFLSLTSINDTAEQIFWCRDNRASRPLSDNLMFIQYRSLCGVIQFNETDFYQSKVIRKGLFCPETNGQIKVQLYMRDIYYMNLTPTDHNSYRRLAIRPLKDFPFDDESQHQIQFIITDRYGIELFCIQNDTIILVLEYDIIDLYTIGSLEKTHRIVVNSSITAVMMIDHNIIIGTEEGDIISHKVKRRSKICGACRLESARNETVYLYCNHHFASKRIIPSLPMWMPQ